MKAFVTGSRKYGKPHKRSDIDLVVMMDEADYRLLDAMADDEELDPSDAGYDPKTCKPLRFGKLNLLVCVNATQYGCWQEGTGQLERMANSGQPITRDFARSLFTRLRKAAGLQK